MSLLSTRFLLTWVITCLVTMVIWFVIPGVGLDRTAFTWMTRGMAEDSAEVQGSGSHADPWQRKAKTRHEEPPPVPVVIGLKDNLDNIFQTSPHAPIDMAVIFNNLRRLGTQRLACSVLLAWEDPDPIGLTAMESALEEFDEVILAAPVTRGAVMETMPPSLRRASIAIADVNGDTASLPVVNRISIPNLIRGGEKTLTGFEVIDSDPAGDSLPLIARWDDRVIFSFTVLATAQQYGVKVSELEVEVGSHLQFGKVGPRVSIDEFGRLSLGDEVEPIEPDLLAEDLIDAKTGDENVPPLIDTLLCDFRSHADITTRDFNRMAPIATTRLLSGESQSTLMRFERLDSIWEMALLLIWATAMAAATFLSRPWVGITGLIAYAAIVLLLWVGLMNALWLPGIAAWSAVVIAQAYAACTSGSRKRTTSMPRLNRLELDLDNDAPTATQKAPDQPEEGQDYALAPKDSNLDSKHESD